MLFEKKQILPEASNTKSTLTASSSASLNTVMQRAGEIILGKDQQIRLAMACILARGHLLIEDVPGVGKIGRAHV